MKHHALIFTTETVSYMPIFLQFKLHQKSNKKIIYLSLEPSRAVMEIHQSVQEYKQMVRKEIKHVIILIYNSDTFIK